MGITSDPTTTGTAPDPVRRPAAIRRQAGAWRSGLAWLAALLLSGLGAAAHAGDRAMPARTDVATAPAAAKVKILDTLVFEPKTLVVHVGDTVEWHNESLLVHTVTADPKLAARPVDVALPPDAAPFDSGFLAPDATFRHTFQRAGSYRYFCIPHEGANMVATVEVRAATAGGTDRDSGE